MIRTGQGKPIGLFVDYHMDPDKSKRHMVRRLLSHRRHSPDGRGRLFLVRGKDGRPDQGIGLSGGALRGGERPHDPSRRAGVRRYRRGRPREGPGGEGHCGVDQRLRPLGRAETGASGTREEEDGALQVPPHHRVRGGAAQDDQRQNTAGGDQGQGQTLSGDQPIGMQRLREVRYGLPGQCVEAGQET